MSDIQSTASLPIQIVPTLLSEGEEWALEFFVQVNPKIDTTALSPPIIEGVILDTPDVLGAVESHTPSARILSNTEQGGHRITWKKIRLKQNEQESPHATFYLRFANSADIEPNAEVRGFLRLRFEEAISTLEEVFLFSPLGEKRAREEVSVAKQTTVDLSFHFHLGGLRLRRLYSVTESIEQLTIIPDSEMITRLVNAMSDKDLYVQRVLENPPHMNRANAQIMNRLWVIAGRRYKKATPIDFRVVAIGQEQYEDSDKPFDGNGVFVAKGRKPTLSEAFIRFLVYVFLCT